MLGIDHEQVIQHLTHALLELRELEKQDRNTKEVIK